MPKGGLAPESYRNSVTDLLRSWPKGPTIVLLLLVAFSACSSSDQGVADVGPGDIGPGDAGPGDIGAGDIGEVPVGPREGFGFSPGAGLRDQDDARLAGDLDAMVAVGADWIRLDVDWSVVEQQPGVYDWSQSDRMIRAARDRDLNVLALLSYSPSWARPPGTSDKAPPDDNQQFARFAAAAVARYSPGDVKAWQIWNEPNSRLFWESGANPEAYGSLLETAAAAIRSASPEAMIISGGLAPAVDRIDQGWLSPETFLEALIETGALAEVDAVGIHPYSFPARPLDPDSADWNTFLKLPALHRLLRDSAAAPDQLWITEYGAPTGAHSRSVTEADQAALLTEGLDAAAGWPWLGPVFLYTLRDFREDPGDLEWNYGILFSDGSPKQAWGELLTRQTG